MIRKIRKRDGKISDFNPRKITNAIWKAAQAVGGKDHRKAAQLTDKVLEMQDLVHQYHSPHIVDQIIALFLIPTQTYPLVCHRHGEY